LQGPAPHQLEIDGAGRVVAAIGEAVPPVAFSSLMAMPDFLKTPKARAFMRAYRRALRFVVETAPNEVAESIASFFTNVSRKALSDSIAAYQALGTWRFDPAITREQYETAMTVFNFAGVFKERYAYEDVVYLEQIE